MPWYSQGQVSVSANSATVTGTGTAFSANARVGDAFRGPDGRWYEITNIVSETVLSIKPNYQGTTASGQAYAIAPMQGYVKESADRLRQLVDQFGSQLAALQPWATAATPAAARTALGASASGGTVFTGSPAQGRTALGLGTAATANVQTSPTDTTPGALMAVGAFGLGGGVDHRIGYEGGTIVGPTGFRYITGTADRAGGGNFAMEVQFSSSVAAFRLSNTAYQNKFFLHAGLSSSTQSYPSQLRPPVEIIHTENIVGTVSQSGGVPTGAAFQFTETASGQTWRNAAGLQICTNSNNPITTDPAAFVGTPTSLDGNKMKIGRWF